MNMYFDNIVFSLQQNGGGSVYWYELMRRMLRDFPQDCRFFELPNAQSNICRKRLVIPKDNLLKHSFFPTALQRVLPVSIPSANSIFHSSYYRVPFNKTVRSVATIHDFIPEKFSSPLRRTLNIIQKKRLLSSASGIICVSENTRKDLLTFFPEFAGTPIKVIHNGVSEVYLPLDVDSRLKLRKEILGDEEKCLVLFVGHRHSYKNFSLAIETVGRLGKRFVLGIVGGALSEAELTKLNNANVNFSFFGRVSDERLNQLYNASFCLLYPSLYEGFGIPVLEAMRVNCPVIAIRSSSIPEVVGDAALLTESATATADELSALVLSLLDLKLQEKLILAGAHRSENFSWEKSYQETREFYDEIVSS